MTSYSYLIPIITWLPAGYDCTIVMPNTLIASSVTPAPVEVERFWTAVCDGRQVAGGSDIIKCEGKEVVSGPDEDVIWRAADHPPLGADGGYLEFGVRTAGGELSFCHHHLPSLYNVYSAPDRKSFFSCHTWKFGSPQVISQIARFGRYVDCYPVVRLDRRRNIGESLVLVNPYQKAILAELSTNDGRKPPRIRIEAKSVRRYPLDQLLRSDEQDWLGQLQITANNRVVTYMVKHALDDPSMITTVEHLDPFRADPTHVPATQWLRLEYGRRRFIRQSTRVVRTATQAEGA